LIIVLIALAGVVYFYRYDIFQYSAERIIKENLPKYVSVDRIIFNLKEGILEVKNFRIKNPRAFQDKYLARIASITCKYRMQGKNILDGIEITEIVANEPVINIERLSNGLLNVNVMGQVMAADTDRASPEAAAAKEEKKTQKRSPGAAVLRGRNISDLVRLTDTINVKDGKMNLLDKCISPRRPYSLTFEDVNGNIDLKLSDDYKDVLSAGSQGSGFVNGDRSQRISWTVSLNPQTADLTMSNRCEVRNLDITLFEPYYDRYSPVVIDRGWVSGTLVFDFDNGNIGSMNTVKLRGLKFRAKQGGSASQFWDVTVPDLIKYLSTSPGEIVFDFKIKGNMKSPRFYPGPVVQNAIQAMAFDKISDALSGSGEGGGEQAGQTDAEKVIDVLRSFMQ